MIAVTQPRKVAATSLAARVAKEQQTAVGAHVGYSVRFNKASSSDTGIKYITDGMLVRELLCDPLLSHYDIVVVVEAHERTLCTDLLITNLKMIQRACNSVDAAVPVKGDTAGSLHPLKAAMRATLEAEKFSKSFNGCVSFYLHSVPLTQGGCCRCLCIHNQEDRPHLLY